MEFLAHRGEAFAVGEKYGGFGELAAGLEVEFVLGDPVRHLGREIEGKSLPELRPVPRFTGVARRRAPDCGQRELHGHGHQPVPPHVTVDLQGKRTHHDRHRGQCEHEQAGDR